MSNFYLSLAGNDNDLGTTVSRPWRHFYRALPEIGPGDTLYVRGGTYNEGITGGLASGTSWSNLVHIAAYPGETVWLKPLTNGVSGGRVIFLDGSFSYIEFSGINADGSLLTGAETVIWFSTNNLNDPHHIRYKNAHVIAGAIGSSAAIAIGGHPLLTPTGGFEIQNVTIRGGGLPGMSCGFACASYGVYVNGPNNLVEGCDIYDTSGAGIQIYNANGLADNNILRNNRIHDISRHGDPTQLFGIIVAGDDNQVYNNIIYNIKDGSLGDGLNLFSGSDNLFYNNTIFNVGQYGIDLNAPGANTQVKNNIVYLAGNASYVNGAAGTVESNNLFGTNPLFVGAHDFHLQGSSPAINAGATLAEVETDFAGGARPVGVTYDIGAYEYGSSPSEGSPGGSPGSPTSPGDIPSPASPVSPGSPESQAPIVGPTIITDIYSDHDMQCPPSYYGGFKAGRVIRFGDGERLASDRFTGDWRGATFGLTISDFDLRFRQQLDSPVDRYWIPPLTIRMTTRANRAVLGTPYTVFVGPIIDVDTTQPLTIGLTLGDIVSQGMLSDQHQVPWRLIRDGFLSELDEIADTLDLEAPEPIIYGVHRRLPNFAGGSPNPASPQGFQYTPIYLGIEGGYHLWMVSGHACADLPEVLVWTLDETGGLETYVSVLGSGDWLIPHTSAPAYEDRRSATYGNDRRYTLIRGLVGNADADACAEDEAVLTCFVNGIEPIGDGTGAVIQDRIQQYEHFLINFVAHRGPDSYQSGPWLTNPTWDLFGEEMPIVEEASFDACSAIGAERMGAGFPPASGSGSPNEELFYIGAAIIGAKASDRASAGRRWIPEWNRSCGVQFGITHVGQIRVFMLHPTAAIKAAAPLYTDAYEILDGSFQPIFQWNDKANRIPFRADFEHTSGQWQTADVLSIDGAVALYGGEILGEVREYPFAPGITAATHLAILEARCRVHPPRQIILEATIGPNPVDGASLGYLDLGDYLRYKHYATIASDKSEIRLAQIVRHQVQAGKRRVLVEAVDCEELIDYDAPLDPATIPDGGNETCATAIVITEAEATQVGGYTLQIDTGAHATDPSVATSPGPSCGSGIGYHAAWWKYTPTYGQKGHITTGTSDYDTVLVAYRGSCAALEELACNDNDGIFQTSFIEFTGSGPMIFEAGVTYFFLVHGYGPDDAGTLVFTMFAEPL